MKQKRKRVGAIALFLGLLALSGTGMAVPTPHVALITYTVVTSLISIVGGGYLIIKK